MNCIVENRRNDSINEYSLLKRYDNFAEEFKTPELKKPKVKQVYFEGKNYQVSRNAILTINTTSLCNAKCKFCYNEITFSPDSSYVNYQCESFQKLLQFCKAAKIEILAISGGEPTIYPIKLLGLLERVHNQFKMIRIHSNGLNLLKEVHHNNTSKPLYEHINDYNITDISISVAHYNHNINKKIMNLENNLESLSDKDIAKISNTLSLRLSCFISTEGISTPTDALKYVQWGSKLGIKKFIFRSAANIPSYVRKNTGQAEYSLRNRVLLGYYIGEFKKAGYHISYSHLKSDSHIYILRKDDQIVDFSMSGEELDPDNRIRRLILMQNNKLYTSWIDSSAILKLG